MSASVVSLKFSSSTSSSHHILTRRFSSDIVLLFNVPPWCSEPHLKSLLAENCGPVKLVKFLSKAESEAWSSSSTPLPLPVVSQAVESPYFKEKPQVCFHDALVVFRAALGAEQLVGRKKDEPLVLKSVTRTPLTGENWQLKLLARNLDRVHNDPFVCLFYESKKPVMLS